MSSSVPTLTSVRTNRYEMGKNAAMMVIEALEGNRPSDPVVDLGFSVIQRQSSTRRS
jgi:LacI family gluconate utilization system Gnt-I transcriptional repressor